MGNKIGNIHAWFVLHRGMMISAILCTIAAFITIFVAIGGWSESAGRHAILGCIVVACMTVNPIMALFRPKPDHPKRGYFNLFHGVLGGVCVALAYATIFTGMYLERFALDAWAIYTFAAFVAIYSLTAL